MSYSLQQLTLRETHRQKMVQAMIEVITGQIQPEVMAQGKQLEEMIYQAKNEVMGLSAERRKQLVDARPRNREDDCLSSGLGVGVVKGSVQITS